MSFFLLITTETQMQPLTVLTNAWTPKDLVAPPGYTALFKTAEKSCIDRFMKAEERPDSKVFSLHDLGA